MRELTRIITAEITVIAKENDGMEFDDNYICKEGEPHREIKADLEKSLKEFLCADNVVVTKVQDFLGEAK